MTLIRNFNDVSKLDPATTWAIEARKLYRPYIAASAVYTSTIADDVADGGTLIVQNVDFLTHMAPWPDAPKERSDMINKSIMEETLGVLEQKKIQRGADLQLVFTTAKDPATVKAALARLAPALADSAVIRQPVQADFQAQTPAKPLI